MKTTQNTLSANIALGTLLFGALLFAGCSVATSTKVLHSAGQKVTDVSVAQSELTALAQDVFEQAKTQGVNFANGPCLGNITPDWVVDVVHAPRQAVDDKPENQCAAYRSGTAHHFIEISETGKILTIH